MLEHQASSVNATNKSGKTALHIAALSDSIEMCKVLMDFGATVNPVMRTNKVSCGRPLTSRNNRRPVPRVKRPFSHIRQATKQATNKQVHSYAYMHFPPVLPLDPISRGASLTLRSFLLSIPERPDDPFGCSSFERQLRSREISCAARGAPVFENH